MTTESVSKFELAGRVAKLAKHFNQVLPSTNGWRMCRSCYVVAAAFQELVHHDRCEVGKLLAMCLAIERERQNLPVGCRVSPDE